jgi:uncharacterized membrane protein HdeD (DUF308 family)
MLDFLVKHYWVFLVRGCLVVVFGIIVLILWPLLHLGALKLIFGPFIFCDGLVPAAAFIIERDRKIRPALLEGALGMMIGLLVYFIPGVGNKILFVLVAIWALGTGLVRLLIGFGLRRLGESAILLELSAVTSMAFGIVFVLQFTRGGMSLVWMISTYTVIQGSFLILAGLKFLGKTKKPMSQA